jgi:hypothetical protein
MMKAMPEEEFKAVDCMVIGLQHLEGVNMHFTTVL